MKFKIWDKVRLTREAIARNPRIDFEEYEISWWEISSITDYWHYVIWKSRSDWNENELEFVPEGPEFKRGEIVEVFSIPSDTWFKRIFVCEIPWATHPYVCVDGVSSTMFREWKKFNITTRDKIRKIEQKLTRKEIAERFWVNEDFELIED